MQLFSDSYSRSRWLNCRNARKINILLQLCARQGFMEGELGLWAGSFEEDLRLMKSAAACETSDKLDLEGN